MTIIDDSGNTEYKDTIDTHGNPVYEAQFNLNDDTYTFAVEAGYEDGGKFYALSDRAQVEFDIPGDYRKYHQDTNIVNALLDDILLEPCLVKRGMTLTLTTIRTGISMVTGDGSSDAEPGVIPGITTEILDPEPRIRRTGSTRNNEVDARKRSQFGSGTQAANTFDHLFEQSIQLTVPLGI